MRWLGWLLLVAIFSAACVWLSQWQFSRRADVVARNTVIERNYDRPPVPLDTVLKSDRLPKNQEWRQVVITGHFYPQQSVLVRNRPFNGSPGFLQVIPFITDTGEAIAVETGWLPTGEKQDSPDLIPAPGAQTQTITIRLRAVEPSLRAAPPKQISAINIQELKAKIGGSLQFFESFYGRLASSYSNGNFPKLLPKPELTEGNHLSYAMQWILFALMSFFAFGWAIRQERLRKKLGSDSNSARLVPKRLSDKDARVEDAILDSALED